MGRGWGEGKGEAKWGKGGLGASEGRKVGEGRLGNMGRWGGERRRVMHQNWGRRSKEMEGAGGL